MTASNEVGYLLIWAGSALRMPLAFVGLVVIAVMAMVMCALFAYIEKRTTGWAHRGSSSPAFKRLPGTPFIVVRSWATRGHPVPARLHLDSAAYPAFPEHGRD